MVRITLITALLLAGTNFAFGQGEFKRMPDFRGQSFGLENFLLQPFNLASQADDQPQSLPPNKRQEHPSEGPYGVDIQVHDNFNLRKAIPSIPRTPALFSQEILNDDVKPVHEYSEPLPHPPRRRQPTGESIAGISNFENLPRRRLPPPETRRPLERPSEFQLTITQEAEEPFQPIGESRPERQRKRVMKRRRKKPSTPQPEVSKEEKHINQEKDDDPIKDALVDIFGDSSLLGTPTSYQQTKDTSVPIPKRISEEIPQRSKTGIKRLREPSQTIQTALAEETADVLTQYEDKLISEATHSVSHKQVPEVFPKEIKQSFTTENPGESTQKLKSLLKQQNGQLSLSELLQTQNLSLSDFLEGNPGALSALGANKDNLDKQTFKPEPSSEKPKADYNRPQIPKISPKSRPFSKPSNNTKPGRRIISSTTTEESIQDLPKKLQIIEVTSDRPTYNGFAPKNPRTRGGQKTEYRLNNYSKEKIEEQDISKKVSQVKEQELTENKKNKKEEKDEESLETLRTTSRSPVYRLTTLPQVRESTISEHRVVPKRYGEYRSKQRIDRRKPVTDGTTEGTTISESQETTYKTSTVTEEMKVTKEPKNRVRIPFMSVNNPEISVILPNKKIDTTTEKPKERTSPVIRDRINLFKRLNTEEKSVVENTVEIKEEETTEASTQHMTISTEAMTTKVQENVMATTTEEEINGKENSDEIVELLKTGNNAQRLHRILAARNMTVTELLEKRANSSRQPNVTHLFEKQTDAQLSGKHKVTELDDNFHPSTEKSAPVLTTKKPLPVFSEFPSFKIERGEKLKVTAENEKPRDSNGFDELFVDESVIRPIKLPFDKDENREPKAYEKAPVKENVFKPGHRVQLNLSPNAEGKTRHPMPIWNVDEKSIYSSNPYGYPTYDLNKNLAGIRTTTTESSKEIEGEAVLLETVNRNLDANQRLKANINNILKEQIEQVEVVKEVRDDRTFIPPAVKSAIIASGVVMGIALLVFVAIFAACGWKQRQFRLRARSSILNDSLNGSARKTIRRTGTLSPVSFKRSSLYKKSIDFEDSESSISGSSNTSSYLWNTLKHTFQSRNSTLKNRQEKEEKIQERENRSRRNTLSRDDDRGRRNTISRDDSRRESVMTRETDLPRRNTLTRDDLRRDSIMSRDTLSRDHARENVLSRDTMPRELAREDSRRSSCFREENRRLNSLLRENERCSFKKIDPDRNIIQTSVNFKRGGFNGSSRHFDSCDHFN